MGTPSEKPSEIENGQPMGSEVACEDPNENEKESETPSKRPSRCEGGYAKQSEHALVIEAANVTLSEEILLSIERIVSGDMVVSDVSSEMMGVQRDGGEQ